MKDFDTPILLLIFNRPDHTRLVMSRIREIKPKFLFVGADGPRPTNIADVHNCQMARNEVINSIDWPCQLNTLFQENNLGCGKGVSSAINWFFENVEEGIILEDDCYPSLFFFEYCQSNLHRFRDNHRIFHIAGSNFQCGISRSKYSSFISKYPHIWGWATWRRAWNKYKLDISNLNLTGVFNQYAFTKQEKKYWLKILSITQNHEIDTWDYSWIFIVWINKGLTVVSNKNLIKNIGVGADSTHTKTFSSKYDLCVLEDCVDFSAPNDLTIDERADLFYFKHFLHSRTSVRNMIRNVSYIIIPSAIYQKIKSWIVK